MIAILMAHKTWLVNQLAVRLARQLGIMFGMNISTVNYDKLFHWLHKELKVAVDR